MRNSSYSFMLILSKLYRCFCHGLKICMWFGYYPEIIFFGHFLAHLSRRLRGELIVYRSSRRPSVRASFRVSTLSNMNISETNGSIATKFYLKHHWGGGLAALGFGLDWIRTLVSMETESSHRVIMVKTVSPLFLCCFSSDPLHTCR